MNMNPTHLVVPSRLSKGAQFGSTLHRLSLLRLRLDRRLTTGLGIEFVDFASQLHQLTKLFPSRHPACEAGGTGTGASRPGRITHMVRRWFLDDDVKARVARQGHYEVLAECQSV